MGAGFGFSLGRSDGFPTRYGDQHTAAHVDVLVSGIVVSFVILGLCLLAIIPAHNSYMRKVLFCRIFFSLLIGGIIVGGNYGHDWEKGVIKMSSPYKPGFPDEIKGELGLHIALRGINITLKGQPITHSTNEGFSALKGERIDYNEHFSWEWAQGRFGFGKYAGRFSREFREAVLRGLPLPILQVAEYFTFDGEGIRFGRHYRLAGWYTHLILWFAFGTWIITNILFCMVVRTAALFLFITGCLQLAAVGFWACIRNSVELQIPFQTEDETGEIILYTQYGLDFYLVFANSIFCIILSGFITIMDGWNPDAMCSFFAIDPLTIYDELLLSENEIKEERRRMTILQGRRSNDIEMQTPEISSLPTGRLQTPTNEHDDTDYKGEIFLRRKSNIVRQSIRQIKPRIPRRPKDHHSTEDQRVRRPLLSGENAISETEDEGNRDYLATSSSMQQDVEKIPPRPPPKPRTQS